MKMQKISYSLAILWICLTIVSTQVTDVLDTSYTDRYEVEASTAPIITTTTGLSGSIAANVLTVDLHTSAVKSFTSLTNNNLAVTTGLSGSIAANVLTVDLHTSAVKSFTSLTNNNLAGVTTSFITTTGLAANLLTVDLPTSVSSSSSGFTRTITNKLDQEKTTDKSSLLSSPPAVLSTQNSNFRLQTVTYHHQPTVPIEILTTTEKSSESFFSNEPPVEKNTNEETTKSIGNTKPEELENSSDDSSTPSSDVFSANNRRLIVGGVLLLALEIMVVVVLILVKQTTNIFSKNRGSSDNQNRTATQQGTIYKGIPQNEDII